MAFGDDFIAVYSMTSDGERIAINWSEEIPSVHPDFPLIKYDMWDIPPRPTLEEAILYKFLCNRMRHKKVTVDAMSFGVLVDPYWIDIGVWKGDNKYAIEVHGDHWSEYEPGEVNRRKRLRTTNWTIIDIKNHEIEHLVTNGMENLPPAKDPIEPYFQRMCRANWLYLDTLVDQITK